MGNISGGGIFEFESLAPDDDGSPDDLIDDDDHDGHGDHRTDLRAGVSLGDGFGHVGTDAGEAEVVVNAVDGELEGFVDGEEEPSAGHGHHGIPDEADHSGGDFEKFENLPAGKSLKSGGFAKGGGDGSETAVKAEGHVPDLSGEDH